MTERTVTTGKRLGFWEWYFASRGTGTTRWAALKGAWRHARPHLVAALGEALDPGDHDVEF